MNARTILLAAGVAVGCVVEVLFAIELVRHDFLDTSGVAANYLTLTLAVVVASLIVGAAVGVRVPGSTVGPLLVAAGAGTAVGYTKFSIHPNIAAAGFVIAGATALLPLHAGLVHGGGISRRAQGALISGHVALALLGLVTVATARGGTLDRWFIGSDTLHHVRNPVLIADAPGVARACWVAWWIVLLAAATMGLVARWLRWRAEPSRARHREAPVLGGSAAWTLLIIGASVTELFPRVSGARLLFADFGAIMLPSLGLGLVAATIGWVELVRPRLGRVNAGTVELARIQPADAAALRSMLADVFATPNVDVVYARGDRWVDGLGRPFALETDRRPVTFVREDGEAIAAVLHDADVPMEAIELGARVTGAQLHAQRAAALARSRAEAVRAATGRLVRAGDRASTAIESELAAGPLSILLTLARDVREGACSFAEAAVVLRAVTSDVREISHGLFPRGLEDDGLAGTMRNAGVPSRRLRAATEMTCYLLARDDTSAVFDDRGDRILVTRSTPPTVEMVERVEALGGAVHGTVASVPAEQR